MNWQTCSRYLILRDQVIKAQFEPGSEDGAYELSLRILITKMHPADDGRERADMRSCDALDCSIDKGKLSIQRVEIVAEHGSFEPGSINHQVTEAVFMLAY